MSSSAIWEKYRKESQQTICVIGVLILAAKLCKNDGHFNIHEEEEILKIIPHNSRQKKILLQIMEEGGNDPHPIEYHASRIRKLLVDRHQDFLEFNIDRMEIDTSKELPVKFIFTIGEKLPLFKK